MLTRCSWEEAESHYNHYAMLGIYKKANIIQIEHVDYLLIFLVSKEYNKHQSTNSIPTTRSEHVFYRLLTLYSPGINNIQCYATSL
jgi:hypothetical protein